MKYFIFALIFAAGCSGYESKSVGCEDQWDEGYDAAVSDTPLKIVEVETVDPGLAQEIEDLKEHNGDLESIIRGLRSTLIKEREINSEMYLRCETDRLSCLQ